jgi:hypothetical protein
MPTRKRARSSDPFAAPPGALSDFSVVFSVPRVEVDDTAEAVSALAREYRSGKRTHPDPVIAEILRCEAARDATPIQVWRLSDTRARGVVYVERGNPCVLWDDGTVDWGLASNVTLVGFTRRPRGDADDLGLSRSAT